MGSSSYLYIAGYPLFDANSDYSRDLVNLLFQSDEFKPYTRNINERNQMVWGQIDATGTELVNSFLSSVKFCKQRLEIYGGGLKQAKADFDSTLKYLLNQDGNVLTFFENITFESYLEELKNILLNKLRSFDHDFQTFSDYLQNNDLLIESQSLILGLYSILSCVDENEVVQYDLTDIIESGWVDPFDVISQIDKEKIIILTEGKTDSEFLKVGIELFFNHLKEYYHFMDFENSKYESNASRLVQTIKSFVGSGIKNKIIAIFDNDSAAIQEMDNLKNIRFPNNIKILKYPDIDLAKDYPTIGPTGLQYLNINGLAASIELYLGKDILKDGKEYIPIQWVGFLEKVGKYQGSILKKSIVQERFRNKVKGFNKHNYKESDWIELIQIIKTLRF